MINRENPDSPNRIMFLQHLREVLIALYDPSVLGNSPLVALFASNVQKDTATTLRQVLIDAIEALRSATFTPGRNKHIRVYEILRQRFIEQLTQRTVAENMNLSTRQLQREEKNAVQILGDYLWRMYDLEKKTGHFQSTMQMNGFNHSDGIASPVSLDNTQWDELIGSIPYQKCSIAEIIRDVINTLNSFPVAADIRIQFEEDGNDFDLHVQAPLLRQGLLNIFNVALQQVRHGKVLIRTKNLAGHGQIIIEALSVAGESINPIANQDELEIAKKIIGLCKGSLIIKDSPTQKEQGGDESVVFMAEVDLTTAEQALVLVVDDHPDTLQLIQRYLADTRYKMIGARDVQQGLALALENLPQVILLDVMMPESDGWALLGQINVHPRTRSIPVIVCSIIPQARLASSLGAVSFLPKPVRRADLLAALDSQMARLQIKPG